MEPIDKAKLGAEAMQAFFQTFGDKPDVYQNIALECLFELIYNTKNEKNLSLFSSS
jgi:hypothetical protein